MAHAQRISGDSFVDSTGAVHVCYSIAVARFGAWRIHVRQAKGEQKEVPNIATGQVKEQNFYAADTKCTRS